MFKTPAPIARFINICCVLALVVGFTSACNHDHGSDSPPYTPTPITSQEATATALVVPTATAIAVAATQTAEPTATAIAAVTQTAVAKAVATTTARRQPWNVAYDKPASVPGEGVECSGQFFSTVRYLNDGDESSATCATDHWSYSPRITIDLGSSYTITTVEILNLYQSMLYGRDPLRRWFSPEEIRFTDDTGKVIEIASAVGSGTKTARGYPNYMFTFKQPPRLNRITVEFRGSYYNTHVSEILINGTP